MRLLTVSGPDQGGRVTLVAAGLPRDQHIRSTFGMESFAIDDHVLKVACDAEVFASVEDFRAVSHAVAMKKLGEIVALFRSNGLEIRQSKRLLHILRAMTGFRASSATFIERMMKESLSAVGKDRVAALMHPLAGNIQLAATLLAS